VIARYVAREHASLRAWTPPTQEQDQLDALLKTRAFCSRQRSSLNQVRVRQHKCRNDSKSLHRGTPPF